MALKGILRPGFIQLRVLDMDEALTHYIDRVGLNEVSRSDDGRVFLKGWDEFDRHSFILREADQAGIDLMAFKVDSDASLNDFTRRLNAYGVATDEVPAGEQPGVGRRIGFTIPSGHRIELYADIEMSETHPAIENPMIWPVEPRGMKATRFDHALLYGPNLNEVLDLFTNVLDFSLAEYVDTPDGKLAIWLTVSNKAHDIAFVNHAEPGKFHHAAFFLESWNDVGHAADIMTHYNISRDVGPTRHGITRGQTIYFFDPSGNRNEVYAGGYTYYPDNPTRRWSADQVGRGIFYYEGELNEAFLSVVT
ncbi:catechol 2,3-dioxygenase [Rhodobium orientis]|uniref:Metapyrocatechase n=1 Tax=Rhodobium orientis TaxID=34017 RepID=A0A327JWL0_9HYPH|nr:catechol 2,3-dioxygenase [Rhodobium orientis]MBB4301278.1 catechol 2,3-dioxygenase [Rhodobium orientis]MBK5951132.1 catechol 2,3-dioxygenase [Rhodobium orientis]RAI29965.1 catechol 2,3-dioxygenase [Rhodobium orientis]